MSARLEGVLLGLGHMGRHHARKLSVRADVKLRIIDPPKGHSGSVGKPDFAVIAVPTSAHLDVALPLLEAGVPCLIEKPIAGDPEEAAQLAAYAHCLPAHIERFNPALQLLRGERAHYVEAERIAPPSGRSSDVDVVQDLMVHDLDLALWLMGQDIVSVSSIGLSVVSSGADIAQARLENRDGAVANLSASRISAKPVRKLRVFTASDYWSLDLAAKTADRVRWADGSLTPEHVHITDFDALEAEHDALIDHVRGRKPYPISAKSGLRAVELVSEVNMVMSRPGRS